VAAIFFKLVCFTKKPLMQKALFVIALLISFQSSVAQGLLSQRKTEQYYASAIELLQRNEFGGALNQFEEFLNISPSTDLRRIDAEYYRALCALNLYHIDSEKLIENFIDLYPDNPHSAAAYYDLGNFFYNEKNYLRASTDYAKVDFSALSAEQQNNGRFRWGYSLFTQKKLKESLDQFNFIKVQGGQFGPAASYYAGFIEFTLADYSNAMIDLKRAEQSQAYAKIVPYMIANVYYRQKNYNELLAYAAAVKDVEGVSNPEEIALLMAEANFKKADYKSALGGYQLYFQRRENAERGVLSRAGYSAYATGQDRVALEYFKVSASDQDSVGFYSSYYLGLLYLKQQQKQMALTAFDNARKFKSDPMVVEESMYQYAKISFDLGLADQAIGSAERFLTAFPGSTHANEMKELLSEAYANGNNYNKAIEYIESLPTRSPAMDRALQKATYLKGAELFNKGDYAQAVVYFDRSLQNPVDANYLAEASFWTGEAYSVGKKYASAVPKYERVIGLKSYSNPDIISSTLYGLAYAYYNQQQYDRALYNFREFVAKASKTNSNYADAVIRLGDCYYVTKSYPEAMGSYRRAIQLNTADNDYAHLQLGVILGIQRKYAEAGAELDEVIRNFPQSRYLDEAMFQRAQFDFEQGNYPAAVAQFGKIITANKPSKFLPYAYQRRAAASYNLKDYSKTADDYIAVLEKFPSHPIANTVLLPLQEALTLASRSGDFDQYFVRFKSANPDAKGIESIEFEASKNLYFNQEYQKAMTSLGSYISSYPESPRLNEARYYRAESMYRLKDFDNALGSYQEISGDNLFSFTNKVTGRIAELEFKKGLYEKAVTEFLKLSRSASSKKDQFNAWSGLMESYYQLAQYDSAAAYARLILEKGKVNAGAENKASLFLGKIAMARGDYDGAKDEFLNTLNSAVDEYGAEAKYSLAEIFYLNKDYKQCYETLVSLNKDFAAYPEWVGRSFLLMADNYNARGDAFQARGTLKSLIDNFPLQNIKDEAKTRLKKFDDAEAARKADLNKDTTSH
jgi:tetratricopeptide (TPR) repeat protein